MALQVELELKATDEEVLEDRDQFLVAGFYSVSNFEVIKPIEAYDENGRADFNTYVSGAFDGSTSKTEFQRYLDEDFVIQREGFGFELSDTMGFLSILIRVDGLVRIAIILGLKSVLQA